MCSIGCPHSRYHEQSFQSGENENHRQRGQASHIALHARKADVHVPTSDLSRGHEPLLRPSPPHGTLRFHRGDACVMPQVPEMSGVLSTRTGARPLPSLPAASRGSSGTSLTTRSLRSEWIRKPISDPKSLGVGATQSRSPGPTWRGARA